MNHAIILTSHPYEYDAVRAHLEEPQEDIHSQGTVYGYGKFSTNQQTWEVAIAEIAPSNTDAAMETERAIAYWQPNIVLSVGVATGLKDINPGDVVAGIKVYGYESGKETESGFSIRPVVGLASYCLEQRAKSIARQDDWLERIQDEQPNWMPKAVVGAIAAGEKEIASTQSNTYQLLKASYGDVLAIDTSGYGVLRAVHANANTNALIIRGIFHVLGKEIDIKPHEARVTAAKHASAFAFEILAKLGNAESFGLSPVQYAKLKKGIALASKGLLNWKCTLVNDQEIKRPELNKLLDRIQTAESSTTILLGPPGSGKSALMATLGNCLISQEQTVLAIKADQLNGSIQSIEDLQRDLQLDFSPGEVIYAIASREPIVVLIDQLDAVSELLDRKSQRLNLLLSLIQQLTGSRNVHIVASCREFEFRYGSQFSRLSGINQLILSLPSWEKIALILESTEHETSTMGNTLRELLQIPLHLNIFLDVARPEDVFASSQKLLDRLWEERVLKQSEAKHYMDFLEKLAEQMTQDEILWIPKASVDNNPEIWSTLEQGGLLISNPENGTIGFRHQTYYDYTLARAFARGTQSLTTIILERQDGLFVRPILLRGLNYLRGVSPRKYELELTKLLVNAEVNNCALKNKTTKLALHLFKYLPDELKLKGLNTLQRIRLFYIRTHIYTLLIEFIGSQQNPEPIEVKLFTSLLNSETEGIKVLGAIVGSLGWFSYLQDRPEFIQWLKKPLEQARYCFQLLTIATSFASEDVWRLLEDYWLEDQTYDQLSLRIIWNISAWTPERVGLVKQIIQRNNVDWHTVATVSEGIGETLPEYAAKIIRAYLDCLLARALELIKVSPPELSPDANETERSLHAYRHNPLKPLVELLGKERGFYEIEVIAEAYPQSFLAEIWPWFIDLIEKLVSDINPVTVSYCSDRINDFQFRRSEIVQALIAAIVELAKLDKPHFLEFVNLNSKLDLLIVHRILVHGLKEIASEDPERVLEYLLADSRRFSLGSQMSGNRHKETEQLIAAIFPQLSPENKVLLENRILEFKFRQLNNDEDLDIRRRCLTYNREHRLSLLQSIPDELLTPKTKLFKEQEQRALPYFQSRKDAGRISSGFIGARMSKEEMASASNENLLNLFNILSDDTGWNHPKRQWIEDISRAGGAVQQARIFGELIKDNPERFLEIIPALEPQRHEIYVGKALEGLAETDFPTSDLIHIIDELDQQGFHSEDFRSQAATALEEVAKRHLGLPKSSLQLLERWLPEHSQPALEHHRSTGQGRSDLRSPILFGSDGFHTLPSGRGNIVRAIAKGYLSQKPPDLEGWITFIKSEVGKEPHPAVWVDIVASMPPLLNGDRKQATVLFDQVIRNCPEILQYSWALYFISRAVGWFEPQETVYAWLDMLKNHSSDFAQQAYGEILLIQYLQFQDEWSKNRIHQQLTNQNNDAICCGLAHAASHLWLQRRCRQISAEILCILADSSNDSIQRAVASAFYWNRDDFRLRPEMIQVIQAVCRHQNVLLEAANDLIKIIEEAKLVEHNPQIVVEVCRSLLNIGTELTNPARATALIAENLTTLSIQLHRQDAYREDGLQLFEQLLALNLRETQSALEMLDRRPSKAASSFHPPIRRHRRQQSK